MPYALDSKGWAETSLWGIRTTLGPSTILLFNSTNLSFFILQNTLGIHWKNIPPQGCHVFFSGHLEQSYLFLSVSNVVSLAEATHSSDFFLNEFLARATKRWTHSTPNLASCKCLGLGAAAYQLGNTSSRTITEVKQRWARLVLGWETVQVSPECCC